MRGVDDVVVVSGNVDSSGRGRSRVRVSYARIWSIGPSRAGVTTALRDLTEATISVDPWAIWRFASGEIFSVGDGIPFWYRKP